MTKKSKKTIEQALNERRGDIAKRMHIAVVGDGYHIIEIPAADGSPFKVWSGRIWPRPFQTEHAADLFRDDLVDAYAQGNPNDANITGRNFEHFEMRARVLEFLENRGGIADPRGLARDLCESNLFGPSCTDEIPF